MKMNGTDRWSQIVGGLRAVASKRLSARRQSLAYELRERDAAALHTAPHAPFIVSVERRTTSTIVVSWSDATRGRYQDQVWRAGYARAAGICGLTGMPVQRGDMVFRPLLRGVAPVNAFDMILAERVRHAPIEGPE
jgi:hypothetical protein